jgi:cell division protease FtsH
MNSNDTNTIHATSGDKGNGPAKGGPSKGNGGPQKPGGGPGGGGKGPATPAQPSKGLFGLVTVLLLVLMLYMMFSSAGDGQQITLAEFETRYAEKQIDPDSVIIRDDAIVARLQSGPDSKTPTAIKIPLNTATKEAYTKEVLRITGNKAQTRAPSPFLPLLLWFGPFILFLAILWFIISRGLRNASNAGGMLGNFGKSRHRTLSKEMTGITFKDVAGIDEAKEEVTEIIEFLKNPKRFTKLGGRIPRGVLLIGEPGCGKTLLAKAIAGEADVPFFSISGSDFVEMFVGVGASRVRDLFKQAKESSPCIIFLDEIDAVGRKRGSGFSQGGHDEREQTLNAILVEMDGMGSGDGIIVIAATNRADVLDPALVRPGRFDRQITVPLPDVKGRVEILSVHAKKVKLGPNVDLERAARATPMFSGAELAALINEAAISATMKNKEFIEHEDLEEARDKIKFGRARKSRAIDKDENRVTAYHEAGHAVLQALIPNADPLHKVTIIPRGQSLGSTMSLPEKDRLGYGRKWLLATMRVLCGGRIAEEKATSDVSSGASMDISMATRLARTMVVEWGMSERLGFVRYAGQDTREYFISDKEYSDETARIIDDEVRRLVDEAYNDAERIITENWDKVERVAISLLKHETLTSEEVQKLIRGEALSKPTVADLLAAEAAKNDAAAPKLAPPDESPEVPPGAFPSPA